MKKLVFAAALACMGLAFSSCGDTPGCYEITQTIGDSKTISYYYGTKDDVELYIANLEKVAEVSHVDVKYTKKKVSKSESECVGVDFDINLSF